MERRQGNARLFTEFEHELRAVLRPLMGDKESRRARLTRAFAGYTGLLDRISLDGETGVFLSNLTNTLRDYGDLEHGVPAMRVLLESIKSEVGLRDRERIERIIQGFGHEPNPPDRQSSPTGIRFISRPGHCEGFPMN